MTTEPGGPDVLAVEDIGRVRVLTFDRPGALNAFNDDLYDAVRESLEDAAEQPAPGPIWGSCLRFFAVHTLLARGGNDRRPKLTVRRQAACIADQVRTRQGHDGGKFFEQLQG